MQRVHRIIPHLVSPDNGSDLTVHDNQAISGFLNGSAYSYPIINGKIDFTQSEILKESVSLSQTEPTIAEKVMLDLGCGKKRFEKEGFLSIGLDLWPKSDADVLCSAFTLPFADQSIDQIYSRHFFEHFNYEDICSLLIECRRVLKKGGQLHITVPHYSCNTAYLDPTHRMYYAERTFVKFGHLGFKVYKTKMHWMAKDYNGSFRLIVNLINGFFNKFKNLERFCTMIGGMYEIEYFLRVDDDFVDITHKDGSQIINE